MRLGRRLSSRRQLMVDAEQQLPIGEMVIVVTHRAYLISALVRRVIARVSDLATDPSEMPSVFAMSR